MEPQHPITRCCFLPSFSLCKVGGIERGREEGKPSLVMFMGRGRGKRKVFESLKRGMVSGLIMDREKG